VRVRFSEVEIDHMGDEAWEELIPRASAALERAVPVVVDKIKENLSRRGTARTASAPGQPPEFDTGDLYRAVRPGKFRKRKYGLSKEYVVDFPSGLLHEYGGVINQNGVKRVFPPRPFVRPAEAATETQVTAILEAL
jgi:hypothetical protein